MRHRHLLARRRFAAGHFFVTLAPMPLSPADRVALGLDEPAPVQEFLPAAARGIPGAPNLEPNLKLVLAEGEQATAPKLRRLVNEILAGNLQAADLALKSLLAANPRAGLELYVEFAKFSLPQLKAVAVEVNDKSENPRAMSFQDLQRLLTQGP